MRGLPATWITAAIAELVVPQDNGNPFQQGWSPQCESRPADDSEWGVVKTTAIQHGEFRADENKALPKKLDPRPQIEIKPGDILMTCAGPRNRCGVACLVENTRPRLMMSGKMYRFRPHPEILDARYLSYFIRRHDTQLRIDAMKTGINDSGLNLTHSRFGQLPVVVPPVHEQQRIVEKIETLFDEIDKGVESLQAAKNTLGLYRQSLLKSAFEGRLTADWRETNADKLEDPETLLAHIQAERENRYKAALDEWQEALDGWRAGGEVGKKPTKPKRPTDVNAQHIADEKSPDFPSDWGNTRFGALNVTVSDGPFGSNLKTSDYTEKGIRVIRLENIGYGNFIEEKCSYVSVAKYKTIKKHSVYPGTIVISSFVTDAVRSCIVPKSIPLAINKADCFSAVIKGDQTSLTFAAYYLQSPQVFNQVDDLIHGVGRPRINTTQVKELHFPVCSTVEQAEIVRLLDEKLGAADALEAEIDAGLTRASALRQSILKKAFSGQLVLQNPNDEPASELLARIKAEKATSKPNSKRRRNAGQKAFG